jgi:hypothetical protein
MQPKKQTHLDRLLLFVDRRRKASTRDQLVQLAFVVNGHSYFDNELWSLLRETGLDPLFALGQLSYDHIDLFPLFIACGATVEVSGIASSSSGIESLAFRVLTADRSDFLGALRRKLSSREALAVARM